MQEIFVKMFVIDFTNDCKQKPRGSLHHVEKTIYWIICCLLHTIHFERRSDSMNNYQNGVMPYSECTVMDSNHRTQMRADLQSAVVAA